MNKTILEGGGVKCFLISEEGLKLWYNNKHQFINACIKCSKNRNIPSMEVTSKPKLVTPTFNLSWLSLGLGWIVNLEGRVFFHVPLLCF